MSDANNLLAVDLELLALIIRKGGVGPQYTGVLQRAIEGLKQQHGALYLDPPQCAWQCGLSPSDSNKVAAGSWGVEWECGCGENTWVDAQSGEAFRCIGDWQSPEYHSKVKA